MKITAYIDNLIPEDELQEVIKKFNDLYAPLHPEWELIRRDMSNLQWETHPLGGLTLNKSYLKRLAGSGTHTLWWIAHEHYLPAKNNSWGWNFSTIIPGKHIHLARFDTDRAWRESRIINTFGTLVHEVAHSHDSQVYNKLGINIERELGMAPGEYDDRFVHGKSIRYQYIGRDEDINADTIKEKIMPLLVRAYEVEIKISLLQKALAIVRQIITIKTKKDYEYTSRNS